MNFRAVFIALVIGTALVVAAYLVNSRRPRVVVAQPSAAFVKASGKCAECHLGPDHSQIEIYTQSKHGIMFEAQKDLLNLRAAPDSLTTKDMFIPTCATCHMSGLNGRGVTHDPSDRLSNNLFAEVTTPRPNAERPQARMKDVCLQCHTPALVDRVYKDAAAVVDATNEKVLAARAIMDGLKAEGLISTNPFSQTIQFTYFDLWHYYGRTAKHAAFMGGADYVQWHGNYPILQHTVELQEQAAQLRRDHAQ